MNNSMSKNWVDCHFHLFNAGIAFPEARYIPQYSALFADWRIQSLKVGIQRGVMVQPSFLGTNNDLLLDCLNTNPEVLRGVVVVSHEITLNELQRMHQLGVRGIRLNLVGTAHQIPQWTAADSLWENMSLLGWHLEVHTDRGELPNVLKQLPTTVPLVVDHMAKPLDAKANDPSIVALLKRSKSAAVYVKLSGAYRLGQISPKTTAEVLLQELGPDSLLWGSDWPCTNYEKFADFEQLIKDCYEWIGQTNTHTILDQNPTKLYWNELEIDTDHRTPD